MRFDELRLLAMKQNDRERARAATASNEAKQGASLLEISALIPTSSKYLYICLQRFRYSKEAGGRLAYTSFACVTKWVPNKKVYS
jgi:hypothetical protein